MYPFVRGWMQVTLLSVKKKSCLQSKSCKQKAKSWVECEFAPLKSGMKHTDLKMTITAPAVSETFRPDEILQHLPQLHAQLNPMFPAIGVQLRSHVCQQSVCVCVSAGMTVALDVQPPGSKLGLAWCCDGRREAALWTCTFNLGDLLICHIVRADEPQHSWMRLQGGRRKTARVRRVGRPFVSS